MWIKAKTGYNAFSAFPQCAEWKEESHWRWVVNLPYCIILVKQHRIAMHCAEKEPSHWEGELWNNHGTKQGTVSYVFTAPPASARVVRNKNTNSILKWSPRLHHKRGREIWRKSSLRCIEENLKLGWITFFAMCSFCSVPSHSQSSSSFTIVFIKKSWNTSCPEEPI